MRPVVGRQARVAVENCQSVDGDLLADRDTTRQGRVLAGIAAAVARDIDPAVLADLDIALQHVHRLGDGRADGSVVAGIATRHMRNPAGQRFNGLPG